MTTLHIVCGLPASGKSTYARELAKRTHAALFDSDTTTDLIIQAAHIAANIDPHDRDSPTYKKTYRNPVYETLFALATENLPHTDVIIAGPFTSELQNKQSWELKLKKQFPNNPILLHHQEIPEDQRLDRMKKRGALRDITKLED